MPIYLAPWRQAVDRCQVFLGVSQASWMTIAMAAQARRPLSQSELADRLAVEGATVWRWSIAGEAGS